MKKRCTPVENIADEWETILKPKILSYRQVPVPVAAEVLDCSSERVQEMLRSGMYPFGAARQGSYSYTYEIYPLRFIAWYEGKMA